MHIQSGFPVHKQSRRNGNRGFQRLQNAGVQAKEKALLRSKRWRGAYGNRLKRKTVEILELDELDLSLPEHDLLVAIIDRAARDYIGQGTTAIPNKQHHQRSARRFFSGDSKEPFSFYWCCEQLSESPEALRKNIQKRLAEYKDTGIYSSKVD
jgi:hypothetical protein